MYIYLKRVIYNIVTEKGEFRKFSQCGYFILDVTREALDTLIDKREQVG